MVDTLPTTIRCRRCERIYEVTFVASGDPLPNVLPNIASTSEIVINECWCTDPNYGLRLSEAGIVYELPASEQVRVSDLEELVDRLVVDTERRQAWLKDVRDAFLKASRRLGVAELERVLQELFAAVLSARQINEGAGDLRGVVAATYQLRLLAYLAKVFRVEGLDQEGYTHWSTLNRANEEADAVDLDQLTEVERSVLRQQRACPHHGVQPGQQCAACRKMLPPLPQIRTRPADHEWPYLEYRENEWYGVWTVNGITSAKATGLLTKRWGSGHHAVTIAVENDTARFIIDDVEIIQMERPKLRRTLCGDTKPTD